MPETPLRLIKRFAEFRPKDAVDSMRRKRRGLHVLYKRRRQDGKKKFDVVYIGMTTSGMRGRLESHKKTKADLWTHFSAYEVWDNIRDEEIIELEGLFRHFYRKDSKANRLNVQRAFKRIRKVRDDALTQWS